MVDDHRGDAIASAVREALAHAEGDVDVAAAVMASAAMSDPLLRAALTGDGIHHVCRVAVQAVGGTAFGG